MLSLCVLTTAILVSSTQALKIGLACPSTHPDNILGICHSKCGSGWDGIGPLCYKKCPSGWTGVLKECHRWESKISCTRSGCGPWGVFPCCRGGWRIRGRDTKGRTLRAMIVSFRFDKHIEDLGKACLGAAKSIVDDVKGKAQEMVGARNNRWAVQNKASHSYGWGKTKMHFQKGRLNDCGRRLKNVSSGWIKDAAGLAISMYNNIKPIGRRRMELKEAGQSAADLGEPVVLLQTESQVVRDLPDGSIDIEMEETQFESQLASYVTEVIETNFAEEAGEMTDEQKSELEANMRKSLMNLLFEEDSFLNENADLTIADLTGSDDDSSSNPLQKILSEGEEPNFVDVDSSEEATDAESGDRRRLGSTDAATDNEANGRRRLGAGNIDTCNSPGFLISVGAAIDGGGYTGSASLDEGYSSCGLGLFYTLAGGFSSEPSGAEGFVSYNMFGKARNIPGDARWFQIGMDIGSVMEVAGFELQMAWSPDGGVIGMGWTFSVGVGVDPVCVSGGWARTNLISRA